MNKQHGFTLIELLVVIAILGVIAVVVILNIGNLIGVGRVEAANVEFHQVQTAIVAYMAQNETLGFDATIGPGANYPVGTPVTEGVHKYITNPGNLQADYLVVGGTVTNATPVEGSKWSELHFCNGVWQQEECS